MAAIEWSDVTDRFPNDATLAAVDPLVAGAGWAALANELSASFFGGENTERYKTARILYAAHLASSGGGSGGNAAAGPVTMRSEGGVTEQYASGSASAGGANGSTSYGRQFDTMLRGSPRRVGITT